MKTHVLKFKAGSQDKNPALKRQSGLLTVLMITLALSILSTGRTFAHCDTMDGPVIKDAITAIEKNNVNYVLKWIQPQDEAELKDIFLMTMKVRTLSSDAKTIADRLFFETLVRLHRSGEGVPFTGVKPAGTPIDEKILAADKAIETGNLSPLQGLITKDKFPELEKRFKKVMSLKNYDVNDVKAGREYIEAYVQFFKYAEGEEEHHQSATRECTHNKEHQE